MQKLRILAYIAATSLLVAACQQQATVLEPAASTRIENDDLGLALAALPTPFELVSAEGGSWTFTAPGAGGAGALVVSAAPESSGAINLVEAVKARKEWFENTEGGTYFGNRELGGPIGTIYTARGAYGTGEALVEETWAYAIHPGAYRLLTVQYTYPKGESGTRVEQLLEFLGEIEAVTAPETETPG